MIKLTDINGAAHLVHPDAIARITEAGTSSQWHGIASYVKLMDGTLLECREQHREIVRQLGRISRANDVLAELRTARAQELLGNGLAAVIREYPQHADDARHLLKVVGQLQ